MAIYEGGLTQPGKNLFPSADMEGEVSGVHGAEGAIEAHNGTPTASQGYTTTDFLDDSSYSTGEMNVDPEPKMKIVNPDDLSNS